MAILGKIRQRSLILILVIAMALFSFVLADLFRGGGFDDAQSAVATINGIDIDRVEFMQKVENYQQQYAGRVTNTQAMNAIWNQELRNTIFQAEYEKVGLRIEREQMRDLLKNGLAAFEEFKDDAGEFDENKLNEFIANLKEISPDPSFLGNTPINYQTWTEYENDLARTGMYQAYYNMVKAGLSATDSEGLLDHKLENDKVDIRYVQIPYASIPDSTVTVSKEEIAAYIKKNPKQYEVEASRDIYFVQFKEEASAQDEEDIKDELVKLAFGREDNPTTTEVDETEIGLNEIAIEDLDGYLSTNSSIPYVDRFFIKSQLPPEYADSLMTMNIGELSAPYKSSGFYNITRVVDAMEVADSVNSSHIIVPYVGTASAGPDITRTREEAKRIVDSLLPLVKTNKQKFNDVADEINTDGSKGNAGDIGWTRLATFNPQSFDPAYADFIFFNPKGTVGIVESNFGYHIIRIDDAKNYETALKVANLSRAIEPSEATINEVFNKTSKFEIAVQDRDFQEVVQEMEYNLMQATDVKELDENIPGLGSQRQMVRWAFEDESKVGDVRRFSFNGGFAVAVLAKKSDKGLMSVEKASVSALPIIRKEKKAKILRDLIVGTSLDEVAASQDQSVKTALAVNMKNTTLSGAGTEPKVVGAAFALLEGETSNLIDGNNGVYMVEVTKKTPANELPNYNGKREALTLSRVNASSTTLFNALNEKAEIEDNRATMY